MLETWEPSTAGLERPKSETFARIFLSRRMLLLLRSLCIMVGEQPVCRYSIPDFTQVQDDCLDLTVNCGCENKNTN